MRSAAALPCPAVWGGHAVPTGPAADATTPFLSAFLAGYPQKQGKDHRIGFLPLILVSLRAARRGAEICGKTAGIGAAVYGTY
jgi:hypothetical protein